MLNSDDIEVAILAANILRKQKGKSYVANLVKKHNKYEFRKGEGLVEIPIWSKLKHLFNSNKTYNTPLLDMTRVSNNIIYTDVENGEFTFEIPCKE